ncbi:DUF4168 domain-containing protein [Carnimonas nigrificans]|uniref:DUF4168 domain-containing protein n=1 Tax=Carnimonas nigrificans TaxID=64323 RepID=UPI00046E855B|nr:DUF4168 domain-containing protein [Carnimonas nigrificans]
MKRTTAIISAALVSTGMIASPAVFAQSAASQQGGAQASSASAQNFSDAQLKNFANASQSIAGISQDYTKQLQAAGDDSDKVNSIRQEANGKMVKAVQDNHLKVDEFNQIGQSLQQNPDLLKRVQGMVQQQN